MLAAAELLSKHTEFASERRNVFAAVENALVLTLWVSHSGCSLGLEGRFTRWLIHVGFRMLWQHHAVVSLYDVT